MVVLHERLHELAAVQDVMALCTITLLYANAASPVSIINRSRRFAQAAYAWCVERNSVTMFYDICCTHRER